MLEYLGDLGGLADVMLYAGTLMCYFVVKKLFVGKFIKSVYHIQKYTADQTNYDWGQGSGNSKFQKLFGLVDAEVGAKAKDKGDNLKKKQPEPHDLTLEPDALPSTVEAKDKNAFGKLITVGGTEKPLNLELDAGNEREMKSTILVTKNEVNLTLNDSSPRIREEFEGGESDENPEVLHTERQFELPKTNPDQIKPSENVRKDIYNHNVIKTVFKNAADTFMPKLLTVKELAIMYRRIVNKRQFIYKFKHVMEYWMKCVCCRKKRSLTSA